MYRCPEEELGGVQSMDVAQARSAGVLPGGATPAARKAARLLSGRQ